MILGDTKSSKELQFKSIYFNLNNLRPKDKQIKSINPDKAPLVSADSLMNINTFKRILAGMKEIPPQTSLNEVNYDELVDIEGAKFAMPDIDGIMEKKPVGGKKTRRRTRKSKSRKRQTKKRRSTKRRR
jgi:hypothetical protein